MPHRPITLAGPRWHVADTPLRRLRGLLGRPPLTGGEGLVLVPCASVHTCFMPAPIDAVFLNRRGVILRVVAELRPWRAAGCRGAHAVLELPAGTCARAGLAPGDRLDPPY